MNKTQKELFEYIFSLSVKDKVFFVADNIITYTCNRSGFSELYICDLENNKERKIDLGQNPVELISVRPNSTEVIVSTEVEGKNTILSVEIINDKISQFNITSEVSIHELFSRDGSLIAYSDDSATYIKNINTNEMSTVYNFGDCLPMGISPDNEYIVIWHPYNEGVHDMVLVDIKENISKTIHSTVEEGGFMPFAEWKNDSSGFYFTSNKDSDFHNLQYYDVIKSECNIVKSFDFDIRYVRISPDGRLLTLLTNQNGYIVPLVLDIGINKILKIDNNPEGICFDVSWSSNSAKMVAIFSVVDKGYVVFVWSANGNSWSQITNTSVNEKFKLVKAEQATYPSFDGRNIPALIYRSIAESDSSNSPLIVDLHGGPTDQARPGFDRYVQFLVNCGLIVIAPNIRGSGGYGKEYEALDDKEKRKEAIKDLEYLYNYAEKLSGVDKDKIYLSGKSYGGYMALCGAAFQPNKWKKIIDMYGMSDLFEFSKEAAGHDRPGIITEYGNIETYSDLLKELSPVNYIEDIKAPVMIIHGRKDKRVSLSQSENMHNDLIAKGKKSEFVIYENEGHGIKRKENFYDFLERVLEFLEGSK